MSLEKEMIRVEVANSLGADLEDRLENEVATTSQLEGAADALMQAAEKVPRDLIEKAKKDDNIKDDLTAQECLKIVINYISRCGDYLKSMSFNERQKAITQGGRVDGLKDAMKVIERKRDVAAKKLKMLISLAKEQQEAEEKGEDPPRTPAELARKEHGTLAERREAKEEPPMIDKGKKPRKSRLDDLVRKSQAG